MHKNLLLLISLTVIIVTAYLVYALNGESRGDKSELEKVVNQAKYLYKIDKERGLDFSKGPCLSNALLPGWVVDIVHSPRQQLDDLPENQCASYVQGQAEHFVELDTEGNLVRAR